MIVGWTTFAFGGVYPTTLSLPALLLAALGIAYRPAVLGHGPTPRLDFWIAVTLGAVLFQLVPLPRPMVAALSPGAIRVSDAVALLDRTGPLPLALDLPDAAGAALLLAGSILLFAVARQMFDTGGVRTVARGLATVAVALACLALAQDATGHGSMYWRWRPIYERAFPFGPFVNRNHFGTWAMLVGPLCIGYLVAHTQAHHPGRRAPLRRRFLALLESRAWLLLAAVVLLVVATVVSLSRSSMIGMAAALTMGGVLAIRRGDAPKHEPRTMIGAAILAAVTIGALFISVDPASVSDRISASGVGLAGRLDIWRTSLLVLRDFWITGTGVGTFQTAMAVYQQLSEGLIFNQAHNHYLQVACEGGLLVGIPVVFALAAFAGRAWTALMEDESGMYWLRAGAASGLTGVAVQSLFETGLLTPANAAVAALLAAIVVHVPARFGPPRMR